MKVHKLEIRKTKRKGFRWRARSRNGEIIAAATEEFGRYRGAKASIIAGVADVSTLVPLAWKWGAQRVVSTVSGAVWS